MRPFSFAVLAVGLSLAVPGLAPEPARAAATPAEFTGLSEKALPSVVNISTTQIVERRGGTGQLDQDSIEELFRDYLERRRGGGSEEAPQPPTRRQNSLGSGFVIDKTGYIVTNNHVIENADKISVILQDDTVLEAKLIGRDPKVDVALLKVEAKGELKPLAWGDSDRARVGEWVVAIGNPFGLGGSVSVGIISARARDINAGNYDDFLQTDAAINRGNSGGPLLNMNGEVVGINTAIYSQTGGNTGVGFAASANLVRPVIEDLRRFGRARRGWLGVKIQTVTPEIAESLGLDRGRGAMLSAVDPGSPAASAGLTEGDVVLTFDGKPVEKMRELPRFVAATKVDRSVDVVVWRKGKQVVQKLKVGELKDDEAPVLQASAKTAPKPEPVKRTELRGLGAGVSELSTAARERYNIPKELNGLVVMDVDDSDDPKELRRGDIIDEIQQTRVTTPAEAEAAIAAAKKNGRKTVLLRVVRVVPAATGSDTLVLFVGVKLEG